MRESGQRVVMGIYAGRGIAHVVTWGVDPSVECRMQNVVCRMQNEPSGTMNLGGDTEVRLNPLYFHVRITSHCLILVSSPSDANVNATHPYIRAIHQRPFLLRVLQRHLPARPVSHPSPPPTSRLHIPHVDTYLEIPHQRRHHFVYLDSTNVLAQANVIPGPKLEHGLLHLLDLFSVRQPAFGPVLVGVGAKNAAVTVHDPGVDANDGAARDRVAADGAAEGWDDALEVEAEGRVQTEGFLNAGVEVRYGIGGGEAGCGEAVLWVFGGKLGI